MKNFHRSIVNTPCKTCNTDVVLQIKSPDHLTRQHCINHDLTIPTVIIQAFPTRISFVLCISGAFFSGEGEKNWQDVIISYVFNFMLS